TLAANAALENQKKTNKFFVITKLFVTFVITYFVWLNILNGFPGFVWSVNDAFYRFVKYLKIYEHDKASGYLPE
ncbi:MAG: hypothetical protein PHY99_10280, partial [Bacteroidales bacterium]|nr:hypothetical protein [Bacteroidales bacterium]